MPYLWLYTLMAEITGNPLCFPTKPSECKYDSTTVGLSILQDWVTLVVKQGKELYGAAVRICSSLGCQER